MTHETRRGSPTAHDTGQGGELHAGRRLTGIIPAHRHDTIAGRQHGRDTLAAAAGGHGIGYHGVEVIVGYRAAGGLVNKVIDTLPLTQFGIYTLSLFNGLVGSGGIDLKGRLAVHPVVGAAQTGPLRAHRADMVGSKTLAQRAGVEDVDIFVGHLVHPLIARLIFGPGRLGELVHILFVRVEGHLDLVHDLGKILVEFGMQHHPDILDGKALFQWQLCPPGPRKYRAVQCA